MPKKIKKTNKAKKKPTTKSIYSDQKHQVETAESKAVLPPQTEEELDQKFSHLDDIMERISSINGTPSGDLQLAIEELNAFADSIMDWDFKKLPDVLINSCINHLFYHKEVLESLITETRHTLEENRRELFRKIVRYSKRYSNWVTNIESYIR